ncbi:class I SAM-dependent RNA methyltransferase [Nocardioides seonyuensis]|uniref:Class I SAM-dependent RNA methyltransferase n=1 Tax=Nocardioides seonyuensis TaxID=2518371 RepID=A0A4V1BMM8_9ACTN|nr:TRAM domain-containing protein [Nocardioides seonyuensis]QBX56922.1 class I SAM-dependent RNA methyltransferase [Nocardioides seonyuensis]
MTRRPRPRKARGQSRVGDRFEATVGPVAHGGHFVVRLPEPESRVVFTRHALPGERVVVEITEGTDGDRFWRGDAVEVLSAAPDRVTPPCPFAGPGLCGGCDFQHVRVPAQRDLKASVVREQLVRLGGLAADHPLLAGLVVGGVPVPEGDGSTRPDDGLRWRTRQRYAELPGGQPAMRKHRSHELVAIDDCLIAAEGARPGQEHEAAGTSYDARSVTAAGATHDFALAVDGFWQVHPAAPRVLVETVLEMLSPRAGEATLDLYAGVGLFARFVSDAIGSGTRLVAVEGHREAARHAQANLAPHEGAVVACGSTGDVLEASFDEPFDLVVLDPPRDGAKRDVVAQVCDRRPRAVAYVACDPAALARDVAIFAEHGYGLTALRAFDLFPMTSHTECVALLEPADACARPR